MKRTCLFVGLAILAFGSSSRADVITLGSWLPVGTPTLEDNKSEDDICTFGPQRCAGVFELPAGAERLYGGFGFTGWAGTYLGGHTDYYDAPGLAYDGLTFTYDNGRGYVSSSWEGLHQLLYRVAVTEGGTVTYFLHIEDLPNPVVFDWNDARYTYTEHHVPAVPEPASLLLMGLGLLGTARLVRGRA